MADACLACGEPSTKLCDFVFGFQIVRTLPHPVMDASGMWRCDAPLCDRHAAHVGNVFMCGKFPGAGADTIDICPAHADKDDIKAEPMFKEDGDYLRAQAWTDLRRMFFKITPARGELRSVSSQNC